jgi:hypothetical protein
MVTFSVGGIQRLKGPQPSKKGRTPGPAAEGKGAGRALVSVDLRCIAWLWLYNLLVQKTIFVNRHRASIAGVYGKKGYEKTV